jgi:hypothetical protein
MSRIRSNPLASLLAVISAILILVGRLNQGADWGTPVFIAGIALLVVAAILSYLRRG